ncbi:MAG: nucleotidyltransferase family protein [Planctomycetota bacterium]|jgi:glucose-1-phosphate thymidylyltransferase
MTRKAVILARGLGKRMQRRGGGPDLAPEQQRAASRGLKALMPLDGRPFLDHVADGLLRAGLRDICLVIAPDADLMRQHAARIAEAAGANVECAVQPEPRGTADAVLAAEGFIGGDAFVVANGDNLYPDRALRALAALEDRDCWVAAFAADDLVRSGNIVPERIRHFAVITTSQGDLLDAIVEKPPDPRRYEQDGRLWVSMNLYRFVPAILESCRAIEPDPDRGELELTAAVAHLVTRGEPAFRVMFAEGGVLDLTGRADVASAERALQGRELCF